MGYRNTSRIVIVVACAALGLGGLGSVGYGEDDAPRGARKPIDLLAGVGETCAERGWKRMPCVVLDGQGRPMAGVSVSGSFGRGVTTDEDGRVTVHAPDVYSGDSPSSQRSAWTFVARAPGFPPLYVYVPRGSRVARFRLLERPLRVAGRVLRPDGEPAEGVHIWLSWLRHRSVYVRSDDDGRFEIRDAPPVFLDLSARSKDGLEGRASVIPPMENLEIRLQAAKAEPDDSKPDPEHAPLQAGQPLEIRVVGLWGKLAVRLVVAYADGSFFTVPRIIEENGSARVVVPSGEIAQVGVSAYFYSAGTSSLTPGKVVRFNLARTARIRGRLVDQAFRGVDEGTTALRWAGVRERAGGGQFEQLADPRSPDLPLPPSPDSSHPSGRFQLEGVGPGRYDLVWRSPCWHEAVVVKRDVVMPNPPRDLDLGPMVVNARSGFFEVEVLGTQERPIMGAAVIAQLSDLPRAQRTSASGGISFPIFDRTPFVLEVEAAGHRPWRRLVDPERDGPALRVKLESVEEEAQGGR